MKKELEQMLGGPNTGLANGQQERRWPKAQPRAKSEARRLLKLALVATGLEQMPELDRINDVAALESLLLGHALRGTAAESAIRASAHAS